MKVKVDVRRSENNDEKTKENGVENSEMNANKKKGAPKRTE